MPQFVMIGRDGDAGLERRKTERSKHLDHWRRLDEIGRMVYAGPLLSELGERPVGSLIVFEADTREEAAALMQSDPYVLGGVFASTELHPVVQVLPEDTVA